MLNNHKMSIDFLKSKAEYENLASDVFSTLELKNPGASLTFDCNANCGIGAREACRITQVKNKNAVQHVFEFA